MRGRTIFFTTTILATAAVTMMAMNGHADRRDVGTRGAVGPDVVAWCIGGQNSFDFDYYGSSGGVGGYSMATVSCNWGDEVANWYGGTDQSPVIMQNMFRLKDGRFEQIGMQSFMKHSFCALSEPGCGNCQATNCNTLGIGCADTYWAGLNSGGEAPRSDVNAYTGEYNYPFTVSPSGNSSIRGNLQVANVDVDPSLNSGARYFIEAQYVTEDEATAGNQMNNASWREIGFSSISNPYAISNGPDATNPAESAIRAWTIIDSSVRLTQTYVPNDGKIIVGSKVFDNGDGTFDYFYAVYNMNSDRCIGNVSFPTGVSPATNLGFHDVDNNSGEIYSNTDWQSSVVDGVLSWGTEAYAQNENANALRWGTMYNFSFTTDVAPVIGSIELGIFKPGGPDSFSVSTFVPNSDPVDPCDLPLGNCPEDVDGNNVVNVSDLLAIIGSFGECGDGTYRPDGDVDGDCCVNVTDILAVVGAWGYDCSPVGACCLPDGGCAILTEEDCQMGANGTYQGNDSTCAQSNCPEPGACCFSDGSCDEMMASKCITAGGGFQGNNTTCSTTNCPIAGEGDECSSPLIAYVGPNAFETNTATPSDNQPDESQCAGTYLDWDNSPDIWFLYTAKASGSVHFTTCDPSSYDTSMVLYEDSCTNQVACNGDASGNGCQAYHSAFDYTVSAGSTYYIRIGGWQGVTGEGTLTIE